MDETRGPHASEMSQSQMEMWAAVYEVTQSQT